MKKEPEQKLLEPEWKQRFRKMVEDAARSALPRYARRFAGLLASTLMSGAHDHSPEATDNVLMWQRVSADGEGRVKSLWLFCRDRCGSSLPINRDFFCFFAALL